MYKSIVVISPRQELSFLTIDLLKLDIFIAV